MADKSQSLVPIEQKQVIFYDDELTAVLIKGDSGQQVYVPIRPICTMLGIDWAGQRQRINRDPVLAKAVRFVVITPTNPEKGGNPNMFCLPLDYLNGWLFGINANRVKEELRPRIIRYQEECYRVLAEAFREGRLTADPTFDDLLAGDSPAAQAYKMAQAVMALARQQLLLESRIDDVEGRVGGVEFRLEQVETTLGDPGRHVTPEQASQISQAVKAVAMEMSKRSRRNEYGGVYGELYRKFGITSYKLLPAARFEEAMDFLREWHGSLVGDAPF
jgi:hypothetical protein